jgi:crotonobetainyl-CoA:carnitine CoA-transferase CaiB-like acyl-CoA transferase
MTSSDSPFSDVRVLELSSGTAARTAGMLLAHFGADVVRVLPPGEPLAPDDPRLLCLDRGKRLTQLAGGGRSGEVGRTMRPDETVRPGERERLAGSCDVLLADAIPGSLEPLGLDAAAALDRFPGLVHAWLPPYATRGQWRSLPEDPLLLAALGGFAAHYPATTDRPVAPVVPIVSYLHGALGAAAVAAALLARARNGRGQAVTVTGLHAMAAAQGTMMIEGLDVDRIFAAGKKLGGAPNYRAYQAADGRWLYLAALTPDFFFRALDVLGRMDLLVRPDIEGEFTRFLIPEIGSAVGGELATVFATRTCDEWLLALGEAGVPAAPVSTRDSWLASEVIAANDAVSEAEHPVLGHVVLPGVPVRLSRTPGAPGRLPDGALVPPGTIWRSPRPRTEATAGQDGDGLPLAGLRVVDLSTFLAAPFIGALLADYGATVTKVEAPGGDPYRVYSASYAAVNQRKTGITLDLRAPAGRDQLLAMVADADVLVDNLRPASLDRLGLGTEVLEAANPTLVRCSVSTYGRTGPWADLPGFDPIVQALSGLMLAQGGTGQPVHSTAPVHDAAAGTLGAFGALAALYAQVRGGHGQHVTTSLAAASTFLQSAELTTFADRPVAAEGGVDFPGPTSFRRLYRARDGWLALAAATGPQAHALLLAVGHPEWPASGDGDLATRVGDVLASRTVSEWMEILAAHKVPACPVLAVEGELRDPFLVENDFSHVIHDPVLGRLRVVRAYSDW